MSRILLDKIRPNRDEYGNPIRKGDTNGYGSLTNLTSAQKSWLKYQNRLSRGSNLSKRAIAIYNRIDKLQKQMGLSTTAFASFFSHLRDPIQTIRLYKTRSGVLPSKQTMRRILELETIYISRTLIIRHSIYREVELDTKIVLVRFDYNADLHNFVVDIDNPIILTKEEHYGQFTNRYRNQAGIGERLSRSFRESANVGNGTNLS